MGDRLLLLGYFERLDGNRYLVSAAIELRDAGIDLLAYGEAFRPLLAAITGKLLDTTSTPGAQSAVGIAVSPSHR